MRVLSLGSFIGAAAAFTAIRAPSDSIAMSSETATAVLPANSTLVSRELAASCSPCVSAVTHCATFALHVDLKGNDVGTYRSASFHACPIACVAKSGCNVWTWTNYAGGTCWLKSKYSSTVYNEGAVSGQNLLSVCLNTYIPWLNCDMSGNDIDNIRAPNLQACYVPCSANIRCRAFTWSNHNGGTCWLKRKVDVCHHAPGKNSGAMLHHAFFEI